MTFSTKEMLDPLQVLMLTRVLRKEVLFNRDKDNKRIILNPKKFKTLFPF